MSNSIAPHVTTQQEADGKLFACLSCLHPDERRHLLALLEEGTILECKRPEPPPAAREWDVFRRKLTKKLDGAVEVFGLDKQKTDPWWTGYKECIDDVRRFLDDPDMQEPVREAPAAEPQPTAELPEGVPAPPDGFDYLHYGFLKGDLVRAHVAVLSNGKWVHNADWDGKTIAYIAIRRGTEPHRLNFPTADERKHALQGGLETAGNSVSPSAVGQP